MIDLSVIVKQLHQPSSDDEIVRSQWVPGLVSRVDVTDITIKCHLLGLQLVLYKNKVQR